MAILNPPYLDIGSVHIWQTTADSQDLSSLSPLERAHAESIQSAAVKTVFCSARSFLRLLLPKYLNNFRAQSELSFGQHGKPFLENCDLKFNISHSGKIILIGFAWKNEIGIDVQHAMRTFNPKLADKVFTPREMALFSSFVNLTEQEHYFYRVWSAKEAALKCWGVGLTVPLTRIESGIVDVKLASQPIANCCVSELGMLFPSAVASTVGIQKIEYF